MKISDTIAGILLLALSAVLLLDTQSFPEIPGQIVGPRAFPKLLCILLALSSVGLIVRGSRASAGAFTVSLDPWARSRIFLLRFFSIIGALVFYILFSDVLGFLICATLMLLFLFFILRVPPAVGLATAPVAAVVLHLMFYKGFHIPLPWGPLPILW